MGSSKGIEMYVPEKCCLSMIVHTRSRATKLKKLEEKVRIHNLNRSNEKQTVMLGQKLYFWLNSFNSKAAISKRKKIDDSIIFRRKVTIYNSVLKVQNELRNHEHFQRYTQKRFRARQLEKLTSGNEKKGWTLKLENSVKCMNCNVLEQFCNCSTRVSNNYDDGSNDAKISSQKRRKKFHSFSYTCPIQTRKNEYHVISKSV